VKAGIVLFAHGSRDPEWSRPFERIAGCLRNDTDPPFVAIAYLEHGPSLMQVLRTVASREISDIRVVPVFLGTGGHIKSDVPRLVDEARREFPALRIALDEPIGERPEVIEAIARAILRR
jgi:sirohydrochlorin cobaltochelatase